MDRMDCERMFVSVMELGSFSAAAARQGVSSGQASKMVARLEQILGVQLLVRTTRAVHPTEVGRAYHDRIKPLIEEWDEIDATVRSASGEARGRVRITVPLTFGTTVLTPLLCDFATRHPLIGLDVSFSDRVVGLVEEGFDLALRIGAPRDSSLIARKLCRMRIVTTASPGYLAAQGIPRTPADLAGHACILDANFRDPRLWRFRTVSGAEVVHAPEGRLRFSNAEACAMAAMAGLGVAHGPSFVAAPGLRDGRLRLILPDFEAEPIELAALYPAGRHLAAKVRVLIDFLVERFRGEPPWDTGWQG
jgi:DNA-binding transcriptional LysR family regulator